MLEIHLEAKNLNCSYLSALLIQSLLLNSLQGKSSKDLLQWSLTIGLHTELRKIKAVNKALEALETSNIWNPLPSPVPKGPEGRTKK